MAPTIAEKTRSYGEIRASLVAAGDELKARFEAGESVIDLVHARAAIIDRHLVERWNQFDARAAALVAVGGYGRGELHPYSDVDILLLLPDDLSAEAEEGLSAFVTALWDIGLEIGHSVRTIEQCAEQASRDLTIATTLMEARLLAGPQGLFDAMQAVIAPDKVWPSKDFFVEKRKGGPSSVRLNYLVTGCGWSPMYNLRADRGRQVVQVEYNAVIQQTTGEDWTGVEFTLSTATPALPARL